jgi:hypothetical protein
VIMLTVVMLTIVMLSFVMHNDIQHDGAQYNSKNEILCLIQMLFYVSQLIHYADCCYVNFPFAECYYA